MKQTAQKQPSYLQQLIQLQQNKNASICDAIQHTHLREHRTDFQNKHIYSQHIDIYAASTETILPTIERDDYIFSDAAVRAYLYS